MPDGVQPASILVQDNSVQSVGPYGSAPAELPMRDFGDQYILPGLIDAHIHINEPGRTHWEGFETATKAAAAGGFTCLVDMPLNCIPSTTSVAALAEKRAAASGNAVVDYRLWGGTVHGNAPDLKPLAQAGVAGFKAFMVHPGTEEFSMVEEADLRLAMPVIAECGLPLLVHAESPGPIAAAPTAPGEWRAYQKYLASRPDESEVEAIRLLIRLCAEYKCHGHVVHLSSAKALGDLRTAREAGLPLTVETCPHYLYFAAECIADGNTALKCAPPIRSIANQAELWQALRARQIDLIATDHSPCPPELKKFDVGDFKQAWGGIASVSLALSAVWTKASENGFAMSDIARWMAEKPAELAGISSFKGKIAAGYDADFAVFDAAERWQPAPDSLHFRHKVSPYLGEPLQGRVTSTFLRGQCVYNGDFPPQRLGRECRVG